MPRDGGHERVEEVGVAPDPVAVLFQRFLEVRHDFSKADEMEKLERELSNRAERFVSQFLPKGVYCWARGAGCVTVIGQRAKIVRIYASFLRCVDSKEISKSFKGRVPRGVIYCNPDFAANAVFDVPVRDFDKI